VGTLATVVARIDEVAALALPAPPASRAVLLIGHGNYAHSLWNEYPALVEAEALVPAGNLEAVVLHEQFAPLERICRFHPALTVRKIAMREGHSFVADTVFALGANLVTDTVRARVLDAVLGPDRQAPPPSDRLVLWVSFRLMYRHAVNEADALFRIFQALQGTGQCFDIVLDGFSLPDDLHVAGRYDVGYLEDLARRTAALGDALVARCREAGLDRLRFEHAGSCSLPDSVRAAARVDYYLSHHGTQQHKIGWLFDVPGMIHGNLQVTNSGPARWVQEMANTLNCPRYVPARFIADAESGNERQHMGYFRDYQFAAIDELAEFVVQDILLQTMAARPRG
jgi:hypothetical protein